MRITVHNVVSMAMGKWSQLGAVYISPQVTQKRFNIRQILILHTLSACDARQQGDALAEPEGLQLPGTRE